MLRVGKTKKCVSQLLNKSNVDSKRNDHYYFPLSENLSNYTHSYKCPPSNWQKKSHLNPSRSNPQAIIIHTTLNSTTSSGTIGTRTQLNNRLDSNSTKRKQGLFLSSLISNRRELARFSTGSQEMGSACRLG